VADVCAGDEMPARLQDVREMGEDLGKDITGETEQ
ncbi:hypothetical protein GA0115258_11681, partial [Streptomyces sp. LamerLS-31b]